MSALRPFRPFRRAARFSKAVARGRCGKWRGRVVCCLSAYGSGQAVMRHSVQGMVCLSGEHRGALADRRHEWQQIIRTGRSILAGMSSAHCVQRVTYPQVLPHAAPASTSRCSANNAFIQSMTARTQAERRRSRWTMIQYSAAISGIGGVSRSSRGWSSPTGRSAGLAPLRIFPT